MKKFSQKYPFKSETCFSSAFFSFFILVRVHCEMLLFFLLERFEQNNKRWRKQFFFVARIKCTKQRNIFLTPLIQADFILRFSYLKTSVRMQYVMIKTFQVKVDCEFHFLLSLILFASPLKIKKKSHEKGFPCSKIDRKLNGQSILVQYRITEKSPFPKRIINRSMGIKSTCDT